MIDRKRRYFIVNHKKPHIQMKCNGVWSERDERKKHTVCVVVRGDNQHLTMKKIESFFSLGAAFRFSELTEKVNSTK